MAKLDSRELKIMLAERGYSIRSFSRASKVSEASLNAWINHGKNPRLDTLGRIARTLEIPLRDLITE